MTAGVTVRLVERRSVVRRLPRADVGELVARFRHVVEVTPTLNAGRYRLTARGWAGTFHTANRTWEVEPKVGWQQVGLLINGSVADDSDNGETGPDGSSGLLSLLAGRLAGLMAERSRAGLIRGYAERADESATVRGRIDFPELARRPLAGGERLPQVVDEFTADVPWNQYPLTVARQLLARPGLSPVVRSSLAKTADGFAGVSDQTPTLPSLSPDPRLIPYQPLFAWCRLIQSTSGSGDGSPFLLNLEQLFQTHITSLLLSHPHAAVRPQGTVRLTPLTPDDAELELVPDLLIDGPDGQPQAVWDVKWKRLSSVGPDPADVHQVLGYAAAVGGRVAGLIYPGRRFTAREYATPGGRVRLRVLTARTAGTPGQLRRAADRLVRAVAVVAGGA